MKKDGTSLDMTENAKIQLAVQLRPKAKYNYLY